MYRAFLSYKQLKEYLILLTETDLLRYDKHTQTFKTTEKGLRFLDIYNQMDEMLKVQHNNNNNKSQGHEREDNTNFKDIDRVVSLLM